MKAAIYARYSTDQQDQTSITGQVANCEALAAREGFDVVSRYQDAAQSGNDDNRPQYQQLFTDSEAGLFDAIILDETSRLTRRPGELPRLLEILAFRNQFLIDCSGFDSRQETAGLLASIYGGIDSLELLKIKRRTHRGLRERAKAGFSAGGKTYGYRTQLVDADDPHSKKRLVIVPDEAEVVREIFKRYADHESPKAIVSDLNHRGVPSPGSSWNRTKRRNRGWTHSALVGTAAQFTGMLRRELYIGKQVWNRRKYKKVPGTSRRVFDIRPESEWEIALLPELRIINDMLWHKVQTRLRIARESAHPNNLRPRGRPSCYLLSGILVCGECDAHFIMSDSRAYQCSSHTNGGESLCSNNIRVRRDIAETVLLKNVKEALFTDEMTEYVKKQFKAALSALEADDGDVDRLAAKVREIDGKLQKVMDAVETVGISETLAKRLRNLECQKTEAETRLAAAEHQCEPMTALPDLIPELMAAWRRLVEDMEQIATNPMATIGEIETARNHLHALLGPVILKPQDGILWAHPSPNAKGLVETSPLHINVVAGACFGENDHLSTAEIELVA